MKIPHPGHEKHLCAIWYTQLDVEKLKPLAKKPAFVCKSCGRVANKAENLCDPTPI